MMLKKFRNLFILTACLTSSRYLVAQDGKYCNYLPAIDSMGYVETLADVYLFDRDSVFIRNFHKLSNMKHARICLATGRADLLKTLLGHMVALKRFNSLYLFSVGKDDLLFLEKLLQEKKSMKAVGIETYIGGGDFNIREIPPFIFRHDSLEQLSIWSDSFMGLPAQITSQPRLRKLSILSNYNRPLLIYPDLSFMPHLEEVRIIVFKNVVYDEFPLNLHGPNKFRFDIYESGMLFREVDSGALAFCRSIEGPWGETYFNLDIDCYNRESLEMGMLKDTLLEYLPLLNINGYFSLLPLNRNSKTSSLQLQIGDHSGSFHDSFKCRYTVSSLGIEKFLEDIGRLKHVNNLRLSIKGNDTFSLQALKNLNHLEKFALSFDVKPGEDHAALKARLEGMLPGIDKISFYHPYKGAHGPPYSIYILKEGKKR